MALIQALLSMLGRSAGKVVNAIFGWSVVALFGRSARGQQTLLSILVACAVLWPLLVTGVFAPRAVAFLLAFVPLSKQVPDGIVRAIWLVLTLAVPLTLGAVLAAKAPPGTQREPAVRRLLRGFPATLALAIAFLFVFATVPVLRLVSAVRKRSDEHVPLVTERGEYEQAAAKLEALLERHELGARRAAPPWWMRVPSQVLLGLGGRVFRASMPERLAFWQGEGLQVALYPSDVLVRGAKVRAAWLHGLVAEAFARGPGLQTLEPETQDLERQVQRVWAAYDAAPESHRGSRVLLGRVRELSRDLGRLTVAYEEWQVAYRAIAQLARAIEGEPQLLQAAARNPGGDMDRRPEEHAAEDRPLRSMPMGELLGQFVRQASDLLKKELELARAEIGSSIRSTVTMTVEYAVAGVFGLVGLGLLCTAAVLGLATVLPAWAAALVVAGVALLAAGVFAAMARAKRVRKPFERTQKTLKEDVRWAREHMA